MMALFTVVVFMLLGASLPETTLPLPHRAGQQHMIYSYLGSQVDRTDLFMAAVLLYELGHGVIV